MIQYSYKSNCLQNMALSCLKQLEPSYTRPGCETKLSQLRPTNHLVWFRIFFFFARNLILFTYRFVILMYACMFFSPQYFSKCFSITNEARIYLYKFLKRKKDFVCFVAVQKTKTKQTNKLTN